MNNVTINTFFNTIFIVVLIALSGSAAFFSYQIGYFVLIPAVLFFFRKLTIPFRHTLLLVLTALLIFAQNLYHSGSINLLPSVLEIVGVVTIYFISRLVAPDFSILYRRILIVICIISMIFWTGIQLSEDFKYELIYFARDLPQLSSDKKYDIIKPETSYHFYVFTVLIDDALRNPGLFYEPGRFSIFIVIAFAINLFRSNRKIFGFENLLYTMALISTFSTTGYYAFILLVSTKLLIVNRSKPIILLLIIFSLSALIGYINSLDFMWEKVVSDYENADTFSRFAAIGYHFGLIVKSPLLGWGFHIKDMELSPNGLTILIVRWGVVFSTFYYIFLYKGIPTLIGDAQARSSIIIVIFLTILLLTFSQTATIDPFYFALMFFGFNNQKQHN
jgi:hypothetical protein